MNKSTAWIVGVIVAIVVLGGVWYMSQGTVANPAGIVEEGSGLNQGPAGQTQTRENAGGSDYTPNPEEPTNTGAVSGAKTVMITANDSGFSPATVTIKKGDTVMFMNGGTRPVWPASAMHPTHKVYPGTDIANCGSGMMMFDACKGIPAGGEWSFTFNNAGTWGYHDHLNSSHFGKIVVE